MQHRENSNRKFCGPSSRVATIDLAAWNCSTTTAESYVDENLWDHAA
jgi:hypothetical protein